MNRKLSSRFRKTKDDVSFGRSLYSSNISPHSPLRKAHSSKRRGYVFRPEAQNARKCPSAPFGLSLRSNMAAKRFVGTAPPHAMPPHKNTHKFMQPLQPRPKEGLAMGLIGATLRVNPDVKITHAMGCQGQSFRLFCHWGQGHRGFENPRLFKDRPADGKRSGCAAPHQLAPF